MSTEAQLRASTKYHAKLDTIQFKAKKGFKELLKSRAESNGESVAAYLTRLALEDIEKSEVKNG